MCFKLLLIVLVIVVVVLFVLSVRAAVAVFFSVYARDKKVSNIVKFVIKVVEEIVLKGVIVLCCVIEDGVNVVKLLLDELVVYLELV